MNIAKLDSWVKEKEGIKILDRQAIESLQLEKLNRLLEREYARQGFYRNLPRRLNSLKELENLPFTTEQDLKEQGNALYYRAGSERTGEPDASGQPVKDRESEKLGNLRDHGTCKKDLLYRQGQ